MGVPSESYVIDSNNTQETIEGITRKYERHPSILKTKSSVDSSIIFDFPKAEVGDINAFLKQTPILVKMSAHVIGKHLCNIINMDIGSYNMITLK